jgi:ribosome-associated protein
VTAPAAGGAVILAPGFTIAAADLRFATARAGGPGGQHVNTTDTRVMLHVAVAAIRGGDAGFADRLRCLAGRRLAAADELVLAAGGTRSQRRNRELVLDRLRELVATAAVRPRRRRPTRPTRASRERRLAAKDHHGERKARRRRQSDDG